LSAEEVIPAARALARHGLVDAFGHVSARVGEAFAMTAPEPLGTVDRLVEIPVDTDELPDSAPKEAWIHAGIYRVRPDVDGICRAQPAAVNAAVAPDRERVLAGLRRDDLFTVVLEHFQTDTADYADVLLPATTQLEHDDVHKAYGHLYLSYNRAAIAPLGESLPNTEIFRRLAARMGLDHPELQESDESMIRHAIAKVPGITFDDLRERGSIRLQLPTPHLPYRSGARIPTPSGKIEIDSSKFKAAGLDPIPMYVPPRESEERDPELARRFPLALISPPAHSFLNSTFVNVASLRRSAGKPTLEIHAEDAGRRGINGGDRVRIHNDRGFFTAEAVITDRVRPGVVSAPSVWWPKMVADRKNANQTTSQALTDIGNGATFYDNLVEVSPA